MRAAGFFLLAFGGMLILTEPAMSKSINMGTLSRAAIKAACDRAGGESYGTNGGENYGCFHGHATITCTDEECVANVNDSVPMAGNSLDQVLGISRNHKSATVVPPVNARITQTP
jgi:hypothetical protein